MVMNRIVERGRKDGSRLLEEETTSNDKYV